jgi:NADP-dependent 3-hydroxy acid dehydrogenase YdfG
MTKKTVAQLLKLMTQFWRIVQFPVVYNAVMSAAKFKLHWLSAALRIDNSQPGVKQCTISSAVYPISVRTTTVHG